MAVDHIKIVTVDPVNDAYAWSMIDSATNSNPSWVAITNQQQNGQDTDTWIFTVQANTGVARQAIATVTHSTGITDSFTIDQAGNVGSPPPSSYSSITANTNPIDEGQSLTFTVSGNNLSDGTVPYTLSGAGITAGDIGIGSTGTIGIVGATNSGTLTIPITADSLTEGNETIVITLGSQDSNGVNTGSLSANSVITDSSTTPQTAVQMDFTNSVNITISPAQAQWNMSNISLVSGTVSNSTLGVSGLTAGAQFDANPGETVQLELTLSRVTGYVFTQVGANDVATLSGNSSVTKVSEDISAGAGWPNSMKMTVEYTIPPANVTNSVSINQLVNATTMLEVTPDNFTFTAYTVVSGGIPVTTNISQNAQQAVVILGSNNAAMLQVEYDSNSAPVVADFTLPAWITWSTIAPFSHNSGQNSGTLYFDVAPNSGVNATARTGTLVYIGGQTLPNTGVDQISITQPGITLSQGNQGKQGVQGYLPSERHLKYDIELVGESTMGIPMYHFNYKDESHGKGRFIGTMVDDLERLGFQDALVHTENGILVDYNKIDVPYHTITN